MAGLEYLIKNVNNGKVFPMKCIAWEGYKSTPNMVTDGDSYTNANGMLVRKVLPHVRSKVYITTLELTREEKEEIQKVLPSRNLVKLSYWNDEDCAYDEMDCYIPDIEFTIQQVKPEVTYKPLSITLIEY